MGRHRSDPMGIARLALAGLAVVAVAAMLVIGARALLSTFGSDDAGLTAAPLATPLEADTRAPTLRIDCVAISCPAFVRVPGGDILTDRDLTQGEQATYFEPELDVVLTDAGAVQVYVNGQERPRKATGERDAFKAVRSPAP